jgi:protein-tyrosine-phosphatase
LFVCMANVCRSPALAATLAHLAKAEGIEVEVDSCGVGFVVNGQEANEHSVAAAAKAGIAVSHSAKVFLSHYFDEFDYIFAVEPYMFEELKHRADSANRSKIYLASAFSEHYKDQPIADPYRFEEDGFDRVQAQILDCCKGIVDMLKP